AFLNIQMVDRLYPYVLPTLVFPGVVVHWIGKSCYEAKNWGGALGVDLWMQGPEKYKSIKSCNVPLSSFNLETATAPIQFQAKGLGNVFFKAHRPNHVWILSLNGDYSFVSSGIGKDFTLTADVELNF
ncbi:MAG: hypothetical protein P4L31_06305, partial [Candidatus Babeliales bacterium]|nr:hypothetical protein [Candidatus Babeliales bacterium]